jgi:hypothetical protein
MRAKRNERIVIDLAIDTEELKRLYRGTSRSVVARARDGRLIQFPAQALRPHVLAHGVRGAFALQVADGRLTTLQRLG